MCDKMRNQSRELEVLNRVGQLSYASLELHECLQQIAQLTVEFTHSDACSLYVQQGDLTTYKVVHGKTSAQLEAAWPQLAPVNGDLMPPGTLFSWIAMEAMVLTQKFHDPATSPERFEAVLAVPICNEQHASIGTVALWNLAARTYTPAEITLTSILSLQVFAIVSNSYFSASSRANRKSKPEFTRSARLSSTLNLDELLDLIARTAVELTNSRGCVLRLLNRDQTLLEIKSSYGDVITDTTNRAGREIGDGIAGLVAECGEPMRFDEVTPELLEQEVIESVRHSLICQVPITGKGWA